MYSDIKLSHLKEWLKVSPSKPITTDAPIPGVSTDTRTLKAGELFIALRGENFDGNLYVREAAAKGASAIICEQSAEVDVPLFVVKDALQAFATIGEKLRDRFRGRVVAITGSAGKSSTKDMVATLLGDHVVKSPASFNNLLGVSKTLTLLKDDTKHLVLEMGMNAFHEIEEMCKHFRPQAGLITNIGDAHIGKLGGKEGIYKSKKELFDFLAKEKDLVGIAVNQDDSLVVKAATEAFHGKAKTVTFSCKDKNADVYLSDIKLDANSGALSATVRYQSETHKVNVPIFGKHHAYNLAAALAMSQLLGLTWKEISTRIDKIRPAYHRGEVITLPQGRVLIDESYNCNPTALKESLSSLMDLNPTKKRVFVIGEMRELGEFSQLLHEQLGEFFLDCHEHKAFPFALITVGEDARYISERVKSKLPNFSTAHVHRWEEAVEKVKENFDADSILFVKGSRGILLDKLVADVQNHFAS